MLRLKYTFEISIAGCNTECAHCYVSGGPSSVIHFEKYIEAIQILKNILTKVDGEIYVTLGNEICNHPQITELISFTHEHMPSYYSYNQMLVPTTGIALIKRKDKSSVLDALKRAGCSGFMFTLHGNKEHHNLITKNKDAYDSLKEAVSCLYAEGFEIKINLMLNKFFSSDWQSICEFITLFPNADRRLTIPLYLPTDRMRRFQQYRADYKDCMKLKGWLKDVDIDEETFIKEVQENCENSVSDKLSGRNCFDYIAENKSSQQWAFFNIEQNLDLYYGNAGLHTRFLGNLFNRPLSKLS